MGALGRLTRKINKRDGDLRPLMRQAVRDARIERLELEKERTIGEIQPPHPSRYQSHGIEFKGSVWNGECNRAACDTLGAIYYNAGTYSYYCIPCARAINRAGTGRGKPLCVEVTENLSHERMNELARAQYA